MKNQVVILILLILNVVSNAQPPEPSLGQRWIVNEKFSDEFNGTELDASKWYDYHPTWDGRPPGLFLPSQVKVENGYMSIRGEKMEKDTVITNWDGSKSTYNIAAGAVVSRTQEAYFGYYECRFKAAKTTMSTTFWLSTRGSYPGPAACNDKYGLELDIQECIGREGGFNGSYFAKGMHSNAHFRYWDCGGVKHDYRAPQVLFESDELASDTFNTYGGWWKNENEALFYFNNSEAKSQRFFTGIKSKPFDRPMGLNLVSETYPYPWISLPTDEELADTGKNICYYDWVRAYMLIGVDEASIKADPLIENGGFETGNYTGWTGWPSPYDLEFTSEEAHVHSGTYAVHIVGAQGLEQIVLGLKPNTDYTLSCYLKVVSGSMLLGVKDGATGVISCTEPTYTRKSLNFTSDNSKRVTIYYNAMSENDEGYADDFELVETNPVSEPQNETVMFNERLYFSETSNVKTVRPSLDFLITYMANADREFNFQLYNSDSVLVGNQKYLALAGFGKKQFIMQLDSLLSPGTDYELIADIRPIDSTFADTFQTVSYRFDLLSSVNVRLTILDLRDDSPLSGALVTINDSVKTTDESGRVDFYNLDPGTLPVQIERDGYVNFASDDHSVRNDTNISIRLTPVSRSLTMYISNSYSGLPIENASISIDGNSIVSDQNGRAIHSIYSGFYPVHISHERYADKAFTVNISQDTLIYIELDQTLADAKFVISMDNARLSGASVSIAGKSEITSTIGMANFYNLKTDTVYLYRIENLSELLAEDTVVFHTDSTLRLYYTTGVYTGQPPEHNLHLYPNPAGNHIRVTGVEDNCEFQIRDINGRMLLSGVMKNNGIIDVSNLASGIYFLKSGQYPTLKFTLNK